MSGDATVTPLVVTAKGTVNFAPGTLVFEVVVPREIDLGTVTQIRAIIETTRDLGALISSEVIPEPLRNRR